VRESERGRGRASERTSLPRVEFLRLLPLLKDGALDGCLGNAASLSGVPSLGHFLEKRRQCPRGEADGGSTKATRSDVVGRKISFEILGGLREPSSPEESRKEGLLGLPFKCHATGLPEFLQCCIDVALLAVPPDSFLDLLFALPVPALPPLAATMPAGSFTPGSIPASFATTTFSRCLVAGPPECETE